MRLRIRRIGNAKGIIIPTALLTETGLDTEAEVSVVDGALIVRAPAQTVRAGWADASKALAAAGDDALVMPEFPNAGDAEIEW